MLCLIPAVQPLPVVVAHECSLVSLVRTSLDDVAAAAVVDIFVQETEAHGEKAPESISQRLSQLRGGFWDVYFVGSAFSYSVACLEMVELASDRWNILLCRESFDGDAQSCGPDGLTRYSNGTLTPLTHRLPPGMWTLNLYENWMTDDKAAAQATRAPAVQQMLEMETRNGRIHTRNAADALLGFLQQTWPVTTWNVLVEVAAGAHYYYSEEQFNFHAREGQLSVAIFDRRCDTLEREGRDSGAAAATGHVNDEAATPLGMESQGRFSGRREG